MAGPKIAIVGGGIGGLVLALALRERGISFEVYEQADELREIGAAVALSANGTRELRRLGLGEQVEAVSVVPSALVIRRWDSGEIIADHPIGRDGDLRGDVRRALLRRAPRRAAAGARRSARPTRG